MRHPHVSSGGRYPVLRTLAILQLVAAALAIVFGVWKAVEIFIREPDPAVTSVFGTAGGAAGKIMVAASWLAATFISVLFIVAFAELIKLLIDIEHNTRMMRGGTAPSAGAVRTEVVESVGSDGRPTTRTTWLEGEETAEGALIRGH